MQSDSLREFTSSLVSGCTDLYSTSLGSWSSPLSRQQSMIFLEQNQQRRLSLSLVVDLDGANDGLVFFCWFESVWSEPGFLLVPSELVQCWMECLQQEAVVAQ